MSSFVFNADLVPVKYKDKYPSAEFLHTMARSRGRPTTPLPVHPERVMYRAVKAGLSATVELQRNICNRITKKHYDSSKDIWNTRQLVYQLTKKGGTPDYSHVLKAEPQIRDNMHKILFENAAKYGHTEVNRQKKTDDTVGPVNQRLNANGAALREFSQTMFPMPDPDDFGTRTRRDGRSRKKFRVAGYDKSSFGPRVTLAHPDLPSMDFGDAVRSHNEYLAVFCAIHDVPVRETTKYSNLFLLLVRPYLEYIYSEFKTGKANFQKGVNWALRQVKQLILDAGYRPMTYIERTVTEKLGYESSGSKEEKKTFFEKQEDEARLFYDDHPAVQELRRLRGEKPVKDSGSDKYEQSEDPILTEKDVQYIGQKATRRSRIAGSILHRRISDLFPSPWHLNDIIYGGDKYEQNSDYIIVSEVPLQTQYGVGKTDLVLLERTITEDGKRAYWEPVFDLEIKTHKGHSWYLEPDYKVSEVRQEPHLQRIVAKFPMSNYPIDDDMWDSVVRSTPTPIAQKQLDVYAQGLTDAYQRATQQDPRYILRGTIVIDSGLEIDAVRYLVELLVINAYKELKHETRKIRRTIFTPENNEQNRIALVVHEQRGPARKMEEVLEVPWGPRYNPFKSNKESKRQFILYLSGSAPTSSGPSASWNAQYYHGLQMLYDLKKESAKVGVIWVDLASQFNRTSLAEARLRLRPRRFSDEEIVKVHPDDLRDFFEMIEVKGYFDDILSYLYHDCDLPQFNLKTKVNKIIIVTGFDTLRNGTPTSHGKKLQVLMDHLLNSLPDDKKATIVWFDSPVPSIEKAVPYSSRALLPFYDASSLSEVVTDIIWNLPVAPKGAVQPEKWNLPIIGDSPMHDDIRVIIHHSPDKILTELTHIPFLRGWSKRFKNKGSGQIIEEREIDDVIPEIELRNRMKLLSLTLIPWLVRLWPKEAIAENSVETLEQGIMRLKAEIRKESKKIRFTRTTLGGDSADAPSILDLVRFRLPDTLNAMSFHAMTAGKINSQRLYRTLNKLSTRPMRISSQRSLEKDIVIQTDELDQEWTFGIKFQSEDDVTQPWWIVLQDPTNDARMLVGRFTHRPTATDGFLWAETSQKILTQSSLDDILGLPQTIMTGSKIERGMKVWSSKPGDNEALDSGVLEVIAGGRSTVGHLRALRQTFPEITRTRPVSVNLPAESFYNRVVESLRRYIESASRPCPVAVHLEMDGNVCQVTFIHEGEKVLQTVTLENTTDLISLLRWPMINKEPMFTDSGMYVTWSVFEDIQYGNLDFLRPYVSYKAARSAPEKLPKRITQFFEESETISIGIEHDRSKCPIVNDDVVDHGECWRITLPSNCPKQVKRQLGRAMTGEEMNGLLAPERLYAGKLYQFEISLPIVSEKDESVVFHEERYIRMFLRNKGLILKRLAPGTYLSVSGQKWIMSISWEDDAHLKWRAQSTVSELFFNGGDHAIELIHGHGLESECKRIVEIITSEIPENQIANYVEFKQQISSGLKLLKYSKLSPPCEIRVIESTKTIFSYGVYPIDRFREEALLRFTIEAFAGQSPDTLFEMIEMSLSEGELSHFNIRNKGPFMKKLTTWVNRHIHVLD